ncbi:hypothetical protein F5H01DRAFT_323698 [Linnemannia elongata]|nr:hypothetical protein F5H01DRAFT_323698 [Linnemannia elongata]
MATAISKTIEVTNYKVVATDAPKRNDDEEGRSFLKTMSDTDFLTLKWDHSKDAKIKLDKQSNSVLQVLDDLYNPDKRPLSQLTGYFEQIPRSKRTLLIDGQLTLSFVMSVTKGSPAGTPATPKLRMKFELTKLRLLQHNESDFAPVDGLRLRSGGEFQAPSKQNENYNFTEEENKQARAELMAEMAAKEKIAKRKKELEEEKRKKALNKGKQKSNTQSKSDDDDSDNEQALNRNKRRRHAIDLTQSSGSNSLERTESNTSIQTDEESDAEMLPGTSSADKETPNIHLFFE